jgi:hypothetical protein
MSALPASLPERLTITLWDLEPAWWDALKAVPQAERPVRLAAAHADLLALLVAEGPADRVAFTEIHNEVQIGPLTDGLADVDAVAEFGMRGPVADFPQDAAGQLLRRGAPPAKDWTLPEEHRWRLWSDIAMQRECTALFTAAPPVAAADAGPTP